MTNGVACVAEELDTEWAVGFGRVDVEDPAAYGILAWHLDDVGGGVTHGVEVGEEGIEIERFTAADGAGKIGVVIGGAQTNGRSSDGRNDDGCRTCSNLPESGGAFFLEFGVRGKILEGEN